jgi:hypothetical protein
VPFFERLANIVQRGGYGVVATPVADGDVANGASDNRGDGARGGWATGGARIVGEASYELLPNGDGEPAITVGPTGAAGWAPARAPRITAVGPARPPRRASGLPTRP